MKKTAVYGLVFALFLLPMVMPKVLADDTAPKAKTLHREQGTHKQRARRIRHRPKSGNKGFLEGLTAEERQVAREQSEERRKERMLLLQKQREENLKKQKEKQTIRKHMQEQEGELREHRKHLLEQRRSEKEKIPAQVQ